MENTEGTAKFSLEDFITKNSTQPRTFHRVFLDNESGHHRANVEDEMAQIASEIETLSKESETLPSGRRSLATNGNYDKIVELQRRQKVLSEKFKELTSQILDSSLLLTLGWDDENEAKDILSQAHTRWCEQNGVDPNETDKLSHEKIMDFSSFLTVAAVSSAIRRIEFPDGSVDTSTVSFDRVKKLYDSMISSEKARLADAVNKLRGDSGNWFEGIDAGFPGGKS